MGNVAGYEYSYVGDEGGKETNRIYYEKNLQGDVIGLLDSSGADIMILRFAGLLMQMMHLL